VMAFEHDRLISEPVKVGSREFGPPVCAEHVTVQAVQKDHDDMFGHRRRGVRTDGIMRIHAPTLRNCWRRIVRCCYER
jgi:hypothetical protein